MIDSVLETNRLVLRQFTTLSPGAPEVSLYCLDLRAVQ
jgi:hypothetical protein